MALDSNRYVEGNVKKSGASPPMLHAGRFPCFSLIWSPTTRSHGGGTGTGGIFISHCPPCSCQRGVAWRVPGSLVTYRPPGSTVAGLDQWRPCGAGPGCMPGGILPAGSRVTIYIPGGNTLTSSRVLTVTCLRAMLETCALGELRSRFSDLRGVSFRVTPVHPVVTWHAPVLPLNKEK